MPVWHKTTQEWVRQERLVVLGIAQEHHSDRCRLFAQWKGFDFPILHDPINSIGAKVVPLMVAIDEYGIVRAISPKLKDFEKNFLDKHFEGPLQEQEQITKASVPDIDLLYQLAEKEEKADVWRAIGDGLALWHNPARIQEAISAYSRCLRIDPKDGATLFRLGVCYRMRQESALHQAGDFQKAVDLWRQALAVDPNQYIWRRRIQQYGPRLEKPYPFYDWIEQARADIRSGNEEPVVIQVRLTGSEIAKPAKEFSVESEKAVSPDPEGRIHRDSARFIETEVIVVPHRISVGASARIHIVFRPNKFLEAHWNNESEPLRLWIELPEGWKTVSPLFISLQPEATESTELRHFDFDILSPKKILPGNVRISAYALYYACEGVQGTCQFLRQDIDIDIIVEQ